MYAYIYFGKLFCLVFISLYAKLIKDNNKKFRKIYAYIFHGRSLPLKTGTEEIGFAVQWSSLNTANRKNFDSRIDGRTMVKSRRGLLTGCYFI